MIAPLFSALVMMLPLNPDGDQGALRALFAAGDVRLSERTGEHWGGSTSRSGVANGWTATGPCRSTGMIAPADGQPGRFEIDWKQPEMRISQTDRTVSIAARGAMGHEQALEFTFLDSGKAAGAALAFRRLRGGCTTQR